MTSDARVYRLQKSTIPFELTAISNIFASFCIVYGDPNQALFFGGMGIVAALVFGNMGAAYGTAKSGVGICSVAVLKPELIIKSIIPVVMAGILGIYGLIISVIISGSCKYSDISNFFQVLIPVFVPFQ